MYSEILRRIASVQAELSALINTLAWADAHGQPAAPAAPPAPAEEDEDDDRSAGSALPVKRRRWRYQPGTWYKIVGRNPFRNGNNYNLFDYLARRYAGLAFSREQLGAAIELLKREGRFSTRQDEESLVVVFLRYAGIEKNCIEMTDAPSDSGGEGGDGVDEALPPEAGEMTYTLLGEMPFRSGVNVAIWERLGPEPFTRQKLLSIVSTLVEAQAFDSVRPPETIVRDFLGRVQEKGKLRRN